MSLTPFQARLVFSTFLFMGAGIAINILYMQDQSLVSTSVRSKAEKVKQRAESDRVRRLALDSTETLDVKKGPIINTIVPVPAVTERAGRFAPSAGQFDRAAIPSAEAEMRMPEIVKSIQQKLVQRGYEPGTPDGVTGVVTRAAIMAYEHDNNLAVTGEPSEPLLQHMQAGPTAKPVAYQRPNKQRSASAEQIIRTVQQSLAQLGYFAGKIDGRAGDDTVRSIREYEMDAGLVPTGRVSAPLLLKLARSASGAKAVIR